MGITYRAEATGALPRPAYLTDARRARLQWDLTATEFARIEDRAVDEAIQLQEDAGLDVVTDGEMRRHVFAAPLTIGTDGIRKEPPPPSSSLTRKGHRQRADIGHRQDRPRSAHNGRGIRLCPRPRPSAGQGDPSQPVPVVLAMAGKTWTPTRIRGSSSSTACR